MSRDAFFRRWRNVLIFVGGVLLGQPVVADPVNLVFVGDIMLDDGPGRLIEKGGDPFAAVASFLQDADYAIGNLECPIATVGQALANKIYSFRAHPRVLPVLAGRFDALSVANNHAGDYGREAFVETLRHLAGQDIAAFGGGRNLSEAHQPLWIERRNLRIAVLGYNEYKPRSFEAGAEWAGVAWSEDSHVLADIRAARAAGADLVIPFMHWGWEFDATPGERQRQLAREMIDAGADLIVGSHPHVTQGAEYYHGKLIVYSLGNFVFDGFKTPAARTGWLLRLAVDKSGLTSWDTVAVQMDDDGSPRPQPGVSTPCGRSGDDLVRDCVNR